MLDMLTNGYIPSVVIAVIAAMLIIGFYIFVIPIMDENKKLKEDLRTKTELLDKNTTDLFLLDKDIRGDLFEMKQTVKELQNSSSDHYTNALSQIASDFARLGDKIELSNSSILKSLADHDSRVSSIISICEMMRETQLSMMGVLYGVRTLGGQTSNQSSPSHLK